MSIAPEDERVFVPEQQHKPIKKDPEEGQSLIIGPAKSGKTSLLGALHLHARILADASASPVKIIIDEGEDGKRFEQLILSLEEAALETGRFGAPGTGDVSNYRFLLEQTIVQTVVKKVTKPMPWSREKEMTESKEETKTYPFCLFDGPGGDLFGKPAEAKPDQERQAMLRELGKNSPGLIMCVDPNDGPQLRLLFTQLWRVLQALAERRHVELKRFAIVLTKADKYFARENVDARRQAEETNPWEVLRKLLPRAAWGPIRQHLDPRRITIACGWASAYGFIPNDGSANYITDQRFADGRLRVFNEEKPEETNWDLWEPFRVLDPFLFVATGRLGAMWPFEAERQLRDSTSGRDF